jgi:outer membrane protein assembly factor BamD
MAPHVEDARERLIALNRTVPEPTKEELADSEAEEQSRTGITFKDRALLLVKRGPVTVNAARVGEPTLVDPPQVTAPSVHARDTALFVAAINDKPLPVAPPIGAAPAPVANEAAAEPAPDANTPLQLENVPGTGGGAPSGGAPAIGAEIVGTGQSSTGDNGGGTAPAASAPPREAAPAADPGAAVAAEAAGVPGAENPGGLKAVGPTNNQALPPVEKPAEAPAQINDVHNANAAQVQTGTDAGATAANGKTKKKTPAPKYDSSDESSSKHKKKKGLDKLNPF